MSDKDVDNLSSHRTRTNRRPDPKPAVTVEPTAKVAVAH